MRRLHYALRPGGAFGPAQLGAGAFIATLPVPAIITVHISGKTAGIPVAQIIGIVLAAGLVSSWFVRGRWRRPIRLTYAHALAAGALLLVIPAWLPEDRLASLLAYFNFFAGVIGGCMVGTIWASSKSRIFSAIDAGLAIFVLLACTQLAIAYVTADSGENAHQSADIAWGGSNYIAGVLGVGGYALLARAHQLHRWGRLLALPGVLAIVTPLTTASRGAILAVGGATVVLMWNLGRTHRRKIAWRAASIAIPVLALIGVNMAVAVRLQSDGQVSKNVDARFELYRLAAEQALGSPVWGTGWTALRAGALHTLGAKQSFAHNLVLSFLQIGGALALPFLLALILGIIVGILRGGWFAAPITAAIIIALSDPFFEGFIGAAIAISVVVRAGRSARGGPALVFAAGNWKLDRRPAWR